MRQPHVWMLGDWEQAEFAPAVTYLRSNVNLSLTPSANDPDLILVVASRPGRFSTAEVETLHRRAPLAKLVALLGSWCEGEVRSGHPWPGVTRIYAHQWQARLPRELETWQPRTATEIDRLMNSRPAKSERQLIGIAAAQRCKELRERQTVVPKLREIRIDLVLLHQPADAHDVGDTGRQLEIARDRPVLQRAELGGAHARAA